MSYFWTGFEKQATSIIGKLPGVASGTKRFVSPGVIKAPLKGPTSGVSVAPRSVAPPLPTPKPSAGAGKSLAPTTQTAMPSVPKPMAQASRGVSTMAI